ncbi:MAG: hypothetical protein NUV78_01905 [Candidatus Zambryskibacteria bacterium]|nr:hypothetical protein [Candidatus Zambryskibacteria bacterium]
MATITDHENLVNGQLKFSKEYFTPQSLAELAAELKEEAGGKVKFLAVRSCSKNDLAIVFAYQMDEGETLQKFVYKVTDKLKRRFGNALTGWDISDRCLTIN